MAERGWIKLICTVGPASMKPRVLEQMERLGVDLLRINLSHTSLDDLDDMMRMIRDVCVIPLCLDTEGAQVRTGRMAGGGADVTRGHQVRLVAEDLLGDASGLTLTPPEAIGHLEPGTRLRVDFHEAVLNILESPRDGSVMAQVTHGGRIGSNKGVAPDRPIPLPSFTEKDRRAIAVACREGVANFALSFANSEAAVRELRAMVGSAATIMAKIESRAGIAHLDEIIRAADAILIDRGDFSREVPFEQLPIFQKHLIADAHRKPIPAYVATNLLDSMVSSARPFRAEINDMVNALLDGANGLVLAAETAIGDYPVQCVRMVRRLIQQHERRTWRATTSGAARRLRMPHPS